MFSRNKKSVEKKVKSEPPKNEKNIFEKGLDWEASKRLSMQKSLKIAWCLVSVLAGSTLLLTIAIMVIMPLKTIQLEIVKVDSSTGIVEIMENQKEISTTYDETMNTFFVKKYIRYRDGYSYSLMPKYYNYVGLMSTPNEQQVYAKWFAPNNPNSPLNVFGQKKTAEINFKSITYLADDIALVRFIRTTNQGVDKINEEHLTATLKFKYVKGSISNFDKEVNPLGFQVVEYRIDEESTK